MRIDHVIYAATDLDVAVRGAFRQSEVDWV